MKQLISFALAVTMVMLLGTPVYAAESSAISPRYVYADKASVNVNINDSGKATIQISCTSQTPIDGITATTYIEKNVGGTWVRVDIGTSNNTWTSSTTASRLAKTYSINLPSTGSYRVITTFLLKSTTTESITRTYSCTY